MSITDKRKKFNSDICIDGKRIGYMRQLARAIFGDSFLTIEVNQHELIFIIRLDNSVDKKTLNDFKQKNKSCKIIVYKPIDISLL